MASSISTLLTALIWNESEMEFSLSVTAKDVIP